MTVLSPPRHPLVECALGDAKRWCAGQIIDDRPALAPCLAVDDLPVLLASTADKIVALASLSRRAERFGDVTGFFAARPALLRLLPHFRTFALAGVGRVPTGMSARLDQVLTALTDAAGIS